MIHHEQSLQLQVTEANSSVQRSVSAAAVTDAYMVPIGAVEADEAALLFSTEKALASQL